MTGNASGVDSRAVTVDEPHCGVCKHVDFHDDRKSTPHCRKWNRPASVRAGQVCPGFRLHEEAEISEPAIETGVEIDWNEPTAGTEAPFYATQKDEQRYSWLCGNCRTLGVAVGTMGRIECTDCSNTRRPTDWDAAYL